MLSMVDLSIPIADILKKYSPWRGLPTVNASPREVGTLGPVVVARCKSGMLLLVDLSIEIILMFYTPWLGLPTANASLRYALTTPCRSRTRPRAHISIP